MPRRGSRRRLARINGPAKLHQALVGLLLVPRIILQISLSELAPEDSVDFRLEEGLGVGAGHV
jgi:hypothetical protein